MSLESKCFERYRPDFARLQAAGFRKTDAAHVYERDFMDGHFRAVLRIDVSGHGHVLSGSVIDLDTGEEYLPLRARHQIGEFVGRVREGYLAVLEDVRRACFTPMLFICDQSNRITDRIRETYGDAPEFPWEKYPGNGTFKRADNGKWYAAILTVARGKLVPAAASWGDPAPADDTRPSISAARDPEEIVEVVNLKARPEEIPSLVRMPGIFPAWHMNKTHWISVVLDDTLADEEIMDLIVTSHELVGEQKASGHVRASAWIIPSNPGIYDVDAGFAAGGGVIEWHQHNDIHPGDTLYIYSSAPNSAILYRCLVEASDLYYRGMFKGRKGYERSMRIRLIERYAPDRYPLAFMKANGGSAIRSARRMPQQLLDAMERKDRQDSADTD